MRLTPRTTQPQKGNKYYTRRENGGWSWAIAGKCKSTGKPDPDCDVLANCVGYACGRFNEEANYGRIKWNIVCNAEDFIKRAQHFGLEVGQEPKVGGIMVWKQGKTGSSKDGAGHVEIVEYKYSKEKIKCSASGYNAFPFKMYTRSIGDGNWRDGCSWMTSKYEYIGCIYNPDIEDVISEDPDAPKLPDRVIDLTFLLDGKEKHIWATVIGGQNYVRLAELDDLGIVKSVSYDATKKMPVVKTK